MTIMTAWTLSWSARVRVLWWVTVMGVGLGGLPAPAAGAEVTFSKDVAPILHRSCVQCHRPGAIAPMSLVSYTDVRPWARAIREKTSLAPDDPDRMILKGCHPEFIENNVGIQQFKDDPSLSDEEIALIATWVANGAPRKGQLVTVANFSIFSILE